MIEARHHAQRIICFQGAHEVTESCDDLLETSFRPCKAVQPQKHFVGRTSAIAGASAEHPRGMHGCFSLDLVTA